MSEQDKNSARYRTLLHIVHAHDHAKAGLVDHAKEHFGHAKDYMNKHVSELKQANKHQEAADFETNVQSYLTKLDDMIKRASKYPKKFFKNDEDMTIEELEKAITMVPGTKPAKIETKVAVDRQPGRDPRYDYKPFHELSHEGQVKATHAFQSKDMGNHHYPVDKQTGEFVNGATRWKQLGSAPQATPGSHGVVVAPEHRTGASVRIHAEGSEHHGKLGIVKLPNPHFPGKVAVQYGLKDHQMEYFNPEQVKLNKSEEDHSFLDKLVDQGRKVLESIKKELE